MAVHQQGKPDPIDGAWLGGWLIIIIGAIMGIIEALSTKPLPPIVGPG